MNTFARVQKAIEYLHDTGKIHSQRDIVDAISGNKVNVSRALKGNPRYFTSSFVNRFAQAYADYVSESWIKTGVGEMRIPDKNSRPHYEAKASAGFMDGIAEGRMSAEFRAMAVPTLNYDFSIDTSGDSMKPAIEDGDVLLCRKCDDRLNPPIGEVCVIDSKDGAVVKQIKAVREDSLVLHSFNPSYPDYTLPFESIKAVAVVVGLIREFR